VTIPAKKLLLVQLSSVAGKSWQEFSGHCTFFLEIRSADSKEF